jgi:hypothetical protein
VAQYGIARHLLDIHFPVFAQEVPDGGHALDVRAELKALLSPKRRIQVDVYTPDVALERTPNSVGWLATPAVYWLPSRID